MRERKERGEKLPNNNGIQLSHKAVRPELGTQVSSQVNEFFAISVFVGNLPSSMSHSWLKLMFKRFGNIVSVYVTKFPNKLGRKFGFVKFSVEDDGLEAIKRMNKIWLKDGRLIVNKARFLKKPLLERKDLARSPSPTTAVDHELVWKERSPERSFKDALMEDNSPKIRSPERPASSLGGKVIFNSGRYCQIAYVPTNSDVHWLNCSIVVQTHWTSESCPFLENWRDHNFFGAQYAMLGGSSMLLSFPSLEKKDSAMKSFEKKTSKWFTNVSNWTPSFKCPDKFIRLKVEGIPLHGWNKILFQEIGNLWGKFISADNCAIQKKKLDIVRITILADSSFENPSFACIEISDQLYSLKISVDSNFDNELFASEWSSDLSGKSDRSNNCEEEISSYQKVDDDPHNLLDSKFNLSSPKKMDNELETFANLSALNLPKITHPTAKAIKDTTHHSDLFNLEVGHSAFPSFGPNGSNGPQQPPKFIHGSSPFSGSKSEFGSGSGSKSSSGSSPRYSNLVSGSDLNQLLAGSGSNQLQAGSGALPPSEPSPDYALPEPFSDRRASSGSPSDRASPGASPVRGSSPVRASPVLSKNRTSSGSSSVRGTPPNRVPSNSSPADDIQAPPGSQFTSWDKLNNNPQLGAHSRLLRYPISSPVRLIKSRCITDLLPMHLPVHSEQVSVIADPIPPSSRRTESISKDDDGIEPDPLSSNSPGFRRSTRLVRKKDGERTWDIGKKLGFIAIASENAIVDLLDS